ncbi:MAG TPA: hypothetical protein H9708_02780 [Candidatus Borkfalkia stercoripullorum]|nr:hypothetical protein [Candidatus Borkfalkia stercoripullorum]
MFKGLEKVFDIIGEILAVLLILVFFVDMLNVQFGFITAEGALKFFFYAKQWGALLLVGVVGLEAMSKRNFVLQIIFLAILAFIIICMFFPSTYDKLIGMIPA